MGLQLMWAGGGDGSARYGPPQRPDRGHRPADRRPHPASFTG